MFDSRRHTNMSDFYQNSRKSRWEDNHEETSSKRDQKTTNQLLLFCDLILTYEKYKPYKEEMDDSVYSPGSSDRSSDSFSSESNSSFNNNDSINEDTKISDTDTENDSWNLITCYCMKPFANRPMIECSVCGTWLHMSCAIIRSNNIPEHFVCQMCRDAKESRRRSARIRGHDRRFIHS